MDTLYIAGPEVFYPDSADVMRRKRELAAKYGFEVVGPGYLPPLPEDKIARGLLISKIDEEQMLAADVMIANMTPFRGISTDVGTAFEIGFMCAMGRAVFAYTNDPREYGTRCGAEWYNGETYIDDRGGLRAKADNQSVEDNGFSDNLMLDGGIISRGGKVFRPQGEARLPTSDLSVYEEALKFARASLDAKQNAAE